MKLKLYFVLFAVYGKTVDLHAYIRSISPFIYFYMWNFIPHSSSNDDTDCLLLHSLEKLCLVPAAFRLGPTCCSSLHFFLLTLRSLLRPSCFFMGNFSNLHGTLGTVDTPKGLLQYFFKSIHEINKDSVFPYQDVMCGGFQTDRYVGKFNYFNIERHRDKIVCGRLSTTECLCVQSAMCFKCSLDAQWPAGECSLHTDTQHNKPYKMWK